jgi:hypothetical protein
VNASQNTATQRLRAQRQRARLRRPAGRHRLRRYAAGLIAAPVGLLSGLARLAGRHPGWGRQFYRWLAGRAARDRIAQDAAIAQAELNDQRLPDPAETVNRPPTSYSGAGGGTAFDNLEYSMGFDFRQATAEMAEAAANTEIEGMMGVRDAVHGIPQALANFAQAYAHVAEALSPANAPLHGSVSDLLGDLYQHILHGVDIAEEIGLAFDGRHRLEINRNEDPRPNEQAWDIQSN